MDAKVPSTVRCGTCGREICRIPQGEFCRYERFDTLNSKYSVLKCISDKDVKNFFNPTIGDAERLYFRSRIWTDPDDYIEHAEIPEIYADLPMHLSTSAGYLKLYAFGKVESEEIPNAIIRKVIKRTDIVEKIRQNTGSDDLWTHELSTVYNRIFSEEHKPNIIDIHPRDTWDYDDPGRRSRLCAIYSTTLLCLASEMSRVLRTDSQDK